MFRRWSLLAAVVLFPLSACDELGDIALPPVEPVDDSRASSASPERAGQRSAPSEDRPEAVRSDSRREPPTPRTGSGASALARSPDEPTVSDREPVPEDTEPQARGQEIPPEVGEPSGSLSLSRIVVTRTIEDREPVGHATRLTDEPVYAFVELDNEGGSPRTVEVSFVSEDGSRRVGHITLEVPADQARWRTWGRSSLVDSPGRWWAEVHADDGTLLGRAAFELSRSDV